MFFHNLSAKSLHKSLCQLQVRAEALHSDALAAEEGTQAALQQLAIELKAISSVKAAARKIVLDQNA